MSKKINTTVGLILLNFTLLIGFFIIGSLQMDANPSRVLPATVFSSVECRSIVDGEQQNCYADKEYTNTQACITSCIDNYNFDTELVNYLPEFAGDEAAYCNNICGIGFLNQAECEAYSLNIADGANNSQPFAYCYDGCISANPGATSNCTDACIEQTTTACENEATISSLVDGSIFCAKVEDTYTANYCSNIQDQATIDSQCETDGFPLSTNAPFCDDTTKAGCEASCLTQGVNSALCSATSGACSYIDELPTDTDAPSISLSTSASKSFINLPKIYGEATDQNTITSIEFNAPSIGSWQDCVCTDGSCNSTNEDFYCEVQLSLGANQIDFRATDSLSNITSSGQYAQKNLTYVLPDENLVAWYTLDDLNLDEETGYFTAGEMINSSATVVTGYNNQAVDFNGDSYAKFEDPSGSLAFNNDTNFTVQAWVYADNFSSGVNARVVSKIDNAGTGNNWILGVDTAGSIYCSLIDSGEEFSINSSSQGVSALTNGEWNHIACTWDGTTFSAYVNTVLQHAGDLTDFNVDLAASNKPVYIAAQHDNSSAFEGIIDDIKIFNAVVDIDSGVTPTATPTPTPTNTPTPTTVPDTAPPVVTIDSRGDEVRVLDDQPTFTGSIVDASNITNARYLFTTTTFLAYDNSQGTIDDLAWQNFLPADGTWDESNETYSLTPTAALNDGANYLYIIAEDQLGNESEHNEVGYLTIYDYNADTIMAYRRFVVEVDDGTAPTINAHPILPDPTVDDQPYIQGYVVDESADTNTNIASIEYSINGEDWISIPAYDGVFDSTSEKFFVNLPELTEGGYTVEIHAVDGAGNDTDNFNQNYSDEFIIEGLDEDDSELIDKSETFDTHDFHDLVFTDGIWGNGYGRLRQRINFSTTQKFYSNKSDYGYTYGGLSSNFKLRSSSDNTGLWFTVDSDKLFYYNRSSQVATDYGVYKPTHQIFDIHEFTYSGNRYLILSFEVGTSSILVDINNTPTNTADDSIYDWSDIFSFGESDSWNSIFRDTRSSNLGFYMIGNTFSGDNIIYLDMNGTPTNLLDDTVTRHGSSTGLPGAYDYTGFYFEQTTNSFIAYAYSYGQHICNDNATPSNVGDDSCYATAHNFTTGPAPKVFDVKYDSASGGYWVASDSGLYFTDNQLTANPNDDTWVRLLDSQEISFERVENLAVIAPANDHIGPEIFFTTREGHIRGAEINHTISTDVKDTYDDTYYDYLLPFVNISEGGGMGFYMLDKDHIWVNIPRHGLYEVTLSRSFPATNTVESLPNPPEGKLEVNNITLVDVQGDLGSSGTAQTLSKKSKIAGVNSASAVSYSGVDFYVSNDGGNSWLPILENQTINFGNSNYNLTFKAVLNRIAGDTPVLDYLRLNYAAYGTSSINHRDIELDYPTAAEVGDVFNLTISIKDDLGFIVDWDGVVNLALHPATNLAASSNCLDYDESVNVTGGTATISVKALCTGAFVFTGVDAADDTVNTTGHVITVTQPGGSSVVVTTITPTPVVNLCGNGELDAGEECDSNIGELTCNSFADFNAGDLSCSKKCKLVTDRCKYIAPTPTTGVDIIQTLPKTGNSLNLVSLFIVLPAAGVLAANIFAYPRWILYAVGWLKDRKNFNKWGVIYDKSKKQPVMFATVRIYSNKQKLFEVVTNQNGQYGFVLNNGSYQLEVVHPEYKTHEQEVLFDEKEARFGMDIALKPRDDLNDNQVVVSDIRFRVRRVLYEVNLVIVAVGFIFSLIISLVTPSTYNYNVVIFYILQFVILLIITIRKRDWGYVYNSKNYQRISGAFVRLFSVDQNRQLEVIMTDQRGRYSFRIKNAEYEMLVSADDYKFPSKATKPADLSHKNEGVILLKVTQKIGDTISQKIPLDKHQDKKPANHKKAFS